MKFRILVAISFLITGFSYAQTCNCEKNFLWVKKTFEENDAGYKYALNTKGKPAYDTHNELFLGKVKTIEKQEECTKLLYQWLTFFRPGHLGIRLLENGNAKTQRVAKSIPDENWETMNVDVPKFEQYLRSIKEPGLEGIWEVESYKIGIKKTGNSYTGFIINSSTQNWKPRYVKLRFSDNNGIFYLSDKSAERFDVIKQIGKNYVQLGRFTLKRLNPKLEDEKSIDIYVKSLLAKKAFIEQLNSTTLFLKIPSFNSSQKKYIDSIIFANRDRILKTENLIIDLRNNGGGNDLSYKEILPFLYTNPIRTVGVEILSTKLNNLRLLDFVRNPDFTLDEKTKKWANDSYDKLEKHLGEFVNLDSVKVGIKKYDAIFPYPKNVGVIINNRNASTTEEFLLAARQSKKVKLFGTSTAGVLDISNMVFVKSPCNEFELGYSLSKSYRIPDMPIDGKGIQPDYYIDSEIQEHEWIEYVSKILNQH